MHCSTTRRTRRWLRLLGLQLRIARRWLAQELRLFLLIAVFELLCDIRNGLLLDGRLELHCLLLLDLRAVWQMSGTVLDEHEPSRFAGVGFDSSLTRAPSGQAGIASSGLT